MTDTVDTNSEFDQLTADTPTRISTPMAASGGPPPGWNQSKTNGGTLNLPRAQHIVRKLTDDPSWLIDPSTSHAAQAVFGAASKVIGMNIQLESASARSEAAKAKNSIAGRVGQSLLKLAETGEVGAGIAAKWYALDSDGKPLYENPTNASKIFEDYKAHVAIEAGVPPADVQLLNFAQQYRDSGDDAKATALEAVVKEHGRNKGAASKVDKSITLKIGEGFTQRISPEEYVNFPITDPNSLAKIKEYQDLKAKVSSGKGEKHIFKKDDADKVDALKTELRGLYIDADTGKRIVPGTTGAATNAPAASALPMPTIKTDLKSGQRYSTPRGDATWDGEKFVQ